MDRALDVLLAIKEHPLFVYCVIFGVSFFESFVLVGEFVPGAAFAFAAGFLASKGVLNIYIAVVCAICGAILADILGYYLGLMFYAKLVEKRFFSRYKNLIEKGEQFFKKHGGKSVFIGRFIGPFRPVVPFIAGSMLMRKDAFIFWAVLSGILWGISYLGIGYLFGNNIDLIISKLRSINLILGVFLLVSVLFYLWRRYR
ncbi:DedA family protein [Hippea maritima]|uniref:SNARE associated Golgi protein-like protein n=1 Tax=Hippea maritima (strain ATCC 700847 / DSM 10411 / MH2) TaxID=760142 RepID=F2LY80_HIPMA|nr:DedA family protein [Hippea maritima]AEA34403.1 SNARE associated Golgi protein-like protein [Hippea maritima DSM 10411]